MTEAFAANVIMPNKHAATAEAFYNGHLLHGETYIGGHVESLESGVFRSDIEYAFRLNPVGLKRLISDLDRALEFCLKCEGVTSTASVSNYSTIRSDIQRRLEELLARPIRSDRPLIYHLDVAAMYPNIILTNRLQPSAMVDESACAVCDFNRPGKQCQRRMRWSWRGEFYTARMSEYKQVRAQLEAERFPPDDDPRGPKNRPFHSLSVPAQRVLLERRLTKYSQKVHKRVRTTEVVKREAIVCQRENSFYIDTVRLFRDRRYEYKDKLKLAKKMLDESKQSRNAGKIEEAGKLSVLYDSLQLAHKCILNSFYGYVMRKGARWYSMEMGGIVCETGGDIIRLARELVEQIGRPLELDTDGIWCMLPWTFPQNYTFEVDLDDGRTKRIPFAYPCGMLNHLVHDSFTNSQYHTLVDPAKLRYKVSSENSIFFEIDGPYRAMILPSSVEEGRLLKKRYAVFADDGRLAELKGFEVKRRGELKIVKVFQTQLFRTFLEGTTLAGCYAEVACVANYWLDILYSNGASMSDAELFEMISENRSMSRSLEEYGSQKSTSISTARRLAEFLGNEMTKDKGLACRFVISAKPIGDPVASRAVPVAIFSAEPSVKRHYLRKWLRDNSTDEQTDPRSIIDWPYYIERLESMIQKLIVIPAAMQGVANPVPRVPPPQWLHRKVSAAKGSLRQTTIADAFKKRVKIDVDLDASSKAAIEGNPEDDISDADSKENEPELPDMEDSFTARLSLLARSKSRRTPALPRGDVSIDADYSIWIQQQRAHWQALRSRMTAQNGKDAGGYLKRVELRLPWQIVHYEVQSPGIFSVWILVDGRMQKLTVTVPRKIYVHSFKDITQDDELLKSILRPVTLEWKLPRPYSIRGQPPSNAAYHLFELTTSEARFAEHQHMLSAAFSHAHIEQVYEADVPLSFHLAHSLGCITAVDPEKLSAIVARSADRQLCFELDDLAGFKSIAYQSYLDESDQRMAILYVGHVHTSDSRHLVALCLSTQTQTFPLRFIIIDPVGRAGITVPNIKKLLSTLQEASELVVKNSGGFFGGCFEDIESPVIIERLEGMDDVVLEYLHRCSKKTTCRHVTMGLLNSDDGSLFRLNLPTIPLARFALASSALNPTSSEWLRGAMKEQLLAIGALESLVPELIALSRYSHLPLGMLVEACRLADTRHSAALTLVADVFLARSIRAQGYLFPPSAPSLVIVEDFASSAVPIERAGAFTSVCLEVELSGLAINAMLEYSRILRPKATKEASAGTIEEALKQMPIGGNDAIFDGCRTLVRNWARDYSGDGAVKQDARRMLGHFYQWIRTSTPYAGRFFHGSSCYGLLSMAMARCLHLLVDHVQRLGSLVIYADTHRLILRTAKEDRWAAQAYWNYLKRQLQSIPELQWIEFTSVLTWRCLIWLDAANFAGCSLPDDIASSATLASSTPSTIDDGKLVMRWAIADYLPPMIQGAFKSTLGQYVAIFHSQLGKASLTDEPALPTFIPNSSDLQSDGPEDNNASRAFLPFTFCQKFLAVVKDIQRVWNHPPPTDRQERIRWEETRRFSLLPGSHLVGLRSGPLEFVKSATAIFSLHAASRLYVYSLRRQSFAILGQSEFADSAQFRHPCRSIRLPDVVCQNCLAVRDLDFGRDIDLQPSPNDISARSIFCQLCSLPMDMASIENELLEKVIGLMLMYQSQDLQCTKCRRMPETNMHAHCRCTGSYTTVWSGEEAMSIVNGYRRVSTAFGMRALEDECVFIAVLQEQH